MITGSTTAVGSFYEEMPMNISSESIVKSMSGVSGTTCVSRCGRSSVCLHAALKRGRGSAVDCLHLKDTDPGDVPISLMKQILIPGNCAYQETLLESHIF